MSDYNGFLTMPQLNQSSHHYHLSFKILIFCLMSLALSSIACSDDALEEFRRSRVKDRGIAYLEEGRKEIERGSYFRAIRVLTTAIQKGAGPEAYELRYRAYEAMGDHEKALSDLSVFINSQQKKDPDLFMLRADMAIRQNNWVKAISDYNRAIDLDPFIVDAYLARGIARVALEQYEQALADFEIALKIEPDNPDLLYNAAMTCLAAGLPRAGRSYANRALQTQIDSEMRNRLKFKYSRAPETTEYEQKAGDVKGILTETVRLASASSATPGIAQNSQSGTVQDGPFSGLPKIDAPGVSEKPKDLNQIIAMIGKENFSGSWYGTYMGLSWSASFSFSGTNTTGVLRITTPSGKNETHYCRGTIDNGRVEASDQLGFRVSGRITDELKFVGHISTPDNKSVPVDIPLQ